MNLDLIDKVTTDKVMTRKDITEGYLTKTAIIEKASMLMLFTK
jgi:hypothetical protein